MPRAKVPTLEWSLAEAHASPRQLQRFGPSAAPLPASDGTGYVKPSPTTRGCEESAAKEITMASSRPFLPKSLVAAGALTSAVLAAVLTLTAGEVGAAAVKAKPVIGQLVLDGGTPASVTGFAWSVTADSSWTKGGGAAVGKPQPGSLRVTKLIDGNSVPALGKIVLGSSFATGSLKLTFGKGNNTSTMVYEMENLYVTELAQGGEDGLSAEELSVVFKKVKWTYTDAQGTASSGAYDVTDPTGH